MGVILKIRRLFGLAAFEHNSDHWKSQRSSAIALFILGYWFVYQLLFFINDASFADIQQWMAQQFGATCTHSFIYFLSFRTRTTSDYRGLY